MVLSSPLKKKEKQTPCKLFLTYLQSVLLRLMTQPDFCNPHTQPTHLRKPACTERSLDDSIVEISYPLLFNWQSSCKLLFPSEWRGTPVRARALSWQTGDTGTAEKAHPMHSPHKAPPRYFNISIHWDRVKAKDVLACSFTPRWDSCWFCKHNY